MPKNDDPPLVERTSTLTRGWTLGSAEAGLRALSQASAEEAPTRRTKHVAGQVVDGKVRLIERIGDGGMGEVWLARHLSLEVDVAVKFTRPHLLDAGTRARLLAEARILARLSHPSIVRVLDCGVTANETPYMVLEALRGKSLAQTLKERRRLSPKAAARILLPVASALAAAHDAGVVHRDLKPDNIILEPDDKGAITPKVLDFGIAKTDKSFDGEITLEGQLMGSPDYMSPEQTVGLVDIDARTDVWAFCVVFYELVTGRQPFARATLSDTLRAIQRDSVPPLDGVPSGDLSLWAILARGLAKAPIERWQSMRELGEHLAGWALHQGVHEDSTGKSLRPQWLGREVRPLSDAPPPSTSVPRLTVPKVVLIRSLPEPAPEAAPAPAPEPAPPAVTPAKAEPAAVAVPPRRLGAVRQAALILVPALLLALALAAAGVVQIAGAGPAKGPPAERPAPSSFDRPR